MGLGELPSTTVVQVVVGAALLTLAVGLLSRRVPPLLSLLAAVVVAAGTWTGLRLLQGRDGGALTQSRPVQVSEGGYVSSQACKVCHPQQYVSWHTSYHRTMTQVVNPETVATDLDGIELALEERTYRFERRGDQYWVLELSPGRRGNTQARQQPVLLSTGSHTLQLYWMGTGHTRRLELIPFHYLIQERRWIPRRASFITPPGRDVFGSDWNTGCILCHATRGQPRVSAPDRMDTRVAEFGIACEACHGPGEAHVEANRNPARRQELHLSEGSDPTIVNPHALPKQRSAEVCGRCHAHGSVAPEARQEVLWSGYTYEPGEDLSRWRHVHRLEDVAEQLGERVHSDGRFWPDGMTRGAGREFSALLETPCFQRGEMTCLSCHSMHRAADDPRDLATWADDQLAVGMEGNAACLQCHASYAERLEEHTHHAPTSSGSTCYNCHMSYTTLGLLKAIRSHQVEVTPSVATSLATGRPNACNQCHLDETLAWTAEHLSDWYGVPPPELSEEQRSVAASVLWTLSGDAAQRAIMAWSMGWRDAQEASGRDWLVPYLAQLLEDPYPAVRFMAARSLRGLLGDELGYDFMAPEEELEAAHRRVDALWEGGDPPAPRAGVLVGSGGELDRDAFAELLGRRNDRPVVVVE